MADGFRLGWMGRNTHGRMMSGEVRERSGNLAQLVDLPTAQSYVLGDAIQVFRFARPYNDKESRWQNVALRMMSGLFVDGA